MSDDQQRAHRQVHRSGFVSAVVLAAGKSVRMGRFKQLLLLDGKSFVEHVVDTLLRSDASEVVVVTGHNAAGIREVLADRPIRFAHNSAYETGMASSIKTGIESVAAESRAVLIALADQPLIPDTVANALIDEYFKQGKPILVPVHNGRKGHPVILDLGLKQELSRMDPDAGLKGIIAAHADDTAFVEVDSGEILVDFDEPSDLARLTR